jgi:hypothetical protein
MNKEQYKTYLRQRLSEDTQTDLRKAEGEKAIKNLEDKASKAKDKLETRVALQKKEQESKTRYGIGGKRRKTQ